MLLPPALLLETSKSPHCFLEVSDTISSSRLPSFPLLILLLPLFEEGENGPKASNPQAQGIKEIEGSAYISHRTLNRRHQAYTA